MRNVGHNEQLGIPTLGVVFVHVAHMWRVMQLEIENQALYDDLFRDTFGLVFGEAIVESVTHLLSGVHSPFTRFGIFKLGQGSFCPEQQNVCGFHLSCRNKFEVLDVNHSSFEIGTKGKTVGQSIFFRWDPALKRPVPAQGQSQSQQQSLCKTQCQVPNVCVPHRVCTCACNDPCVGCISGFRMHTCVSSSSTPAFAHGGLA